MSEETAKIIDEFPIWYSNVSLEPNDPRRALRLEAIQQVCAQADRQLTEALIRLTFAIDRQPPPTEQAKRIYDIFRASDPTFDPESSKHEAHIVVASSLAEVTQAGGATSDFAALGISTAALGGLRKLEVPMDIVGIAKSVLNYRSVEVRERPKLSEFLKAQTIKIGSSWSSKPDEERTAVDADDFDALVKELQSAVRAIASHESRLVNSLHEFLEVQDEELQVLAWLLGGRSNDLDCDFSKIPIAAQPFILGKELADETQKLPGLRNIRALFARVGLKPRTKLTIPEMINETPKDWLVTLMADCQPSPVTHPIHFAAQRRLEVDDEASWIDGWAILSGINAAEKLDHFTLSELIYREQLQHQFR